MLLPKCKHMLHSHCSRTRPPKLGRLKWFAVPVPDSLTGVTRRHRPSNLRGGPDVPYVSSVFQTRPLSHRVGHPPRHYRTAAQRTMWAGFAARGRTSLNCRKLNWTAPVQFTAVQPSPWLYRESTAPLGTKAETTQVRRALPNTKPNKKATKEIKQIQRELNGRGEGGTLKSYPASDESLVTKT